MMYARGSAAAPRQTRGRVLARLTTGSATVLCLLLLLSPAFGRSGPATTFEWDLPLGFPVPSVPENNPMSWEKIELGRFLFYDTRLSRDDNYACASCHQQKLAFTDGLATALGSKYDGVHQDQLLRGTMNLTNVAYAPALTWANNTPDLALLENQMLGPMFNDHPDFSIELGLKGTDAELQRFRDDPLYVRLFGEAFPDRPDPISFDAVTKAIACFERTLISGNSPYDRFALGLSDDYSQSAQRGLNLTLYTERIQCHHCHGSGAPFFTSAIVSQGKLPEVIFKNTGLYNIGGTGDYPPGNQGIFEIDHLPQHKGAFKPPTLRNIAVTAPYMHDGSIATLDEVMDFYAAGGRVITDGPYAGDGKANPYKDRLFVTGFSITPQEKQDVIAFLETLTDEEFLTNPRFADPFAPVSCAGDCDLGGDVTIDEITTGVNIALGNAHLAMCVGDDGNLDGEVSVNELIGIVRAALDGCAGESAATPP